jgi:glutamate-ammonia-ligase adenylyltransferase
VFEGGPPLEPLSLRREMDRHRRRMEKELAGENGGFYNLKLGPGGLLDVDFIVQYYQLCHGGRLPALRARSSLEALTALEQEGLIAPEPAGRLKDGYRFLRRIENRLRIVRDRSAARLPRQAEGLEVMARRLGYRQQQDTSPGALLLADYKETTRSIRAIYERTLG